MEHELPLLTMELLLKESGAIRVSESAKVALRQILEDHALDIAKKAIVFASHAKRQTVRSSDITLTLET